MQPGVGHKYLATGLTTAILCLVILIPVSGQNPLIPDPEGKGNYSIEWIGQYPEVKSKKEKRRLKDSNWFSNLIFGRKQTDLVKPMSVVAFSPDTFWVAEQGSNAIMPVFNGVGEMPQSRKKDEKELPSIVGSCLAPGDDILFTDSKVNSIFLFDIEESECESLNDSLILNQPTGIAYSFATNQIWVVETGSHRLAILNDKGEVNRRIGKRGYADGEFNYPTYIWIDKEGMVYVVDAMNFRVQIFDKHGNFISAFGEIGDASGYMSRPKGIATDSYGHIYIADAMFHVIQVFDREGNLLHMFGSQGQEAEQFWMPTGIFIDKENFIYIADSYNSRIQIFKLLEEN